MPTLAEQCPSLGYTMTELLGKTARQIRALGFEIPPQVEDTRTLAVAEGIQPLVDISTHGKQTGYAWVRPVGRTLS